MIPALPFTECSLRLGLLLRLALLSTAGLASATRPLRGQAAPERERQITRLVTLTSDLEDSLRLTSLRDTTVHYNPLLRSVSILTPRSPRDGVVRLQGVLPDVMYSWNSDLPWGLNDGALWAGRGFNRRFRVGFVVEGGPFRVIFQPEYLTEENRPFQVIQWPAEESRKRWANPFHGLPQSIDLPLRFGDQTLVLSDFGQSSASIDAGPFVVGWGTENLWWGPGILNGILLSNNAAGFAHYFMRTEHPLRTRFGRFEGQWIFGHLDDSEFFLADTLLHVRSLSGLIVTWQPAGVPGLHLGLSRLVMSTAPDGKLSLGSAFDVLRSIGRPNTAPDDSTRRPASDQIFALSARYRVPAAGLEAYTEWARFEEPAGLRDFLEFPQRSQGYTLGVQWQRPLGSGLWRSQLEFTYLEPTAALRLRPEFASYTSAAVPQGFTQRGQVLGATIGPGSSSQMVAGDAVFPRWRLGARLLRLRYDNAALFSPATPQPRAQDVTMAGTLRGGLDLFGLRITAEYTRMARLNYLYQSFLIDPASGRSGGIDIPGHNLTVAVSPILRP